MNNEKIFRMSFASVYPMYIQKAEKKGRTKEEVDAIIFWLTGYNKQTFQRHIDKKTDFETFFTQAPQSQCFQNYRRNLRIPRRGN